MALEGSSKQAALAAIRAPGCHQSKPASTGQLAVRGLDGLASLPSLLSLGGSGRDFSEGGVSGRQGTQASCTGSNSKASSSLFAGYGTISSRRFTDSNASFQNPLAGSPTAALLKAGSARFGSSNGAGPSSSFSPAHSGEKTALPPPSLAERVARARGASSGGQHASLGGDANARHNNAYPSPPVSPPVHSLSQQIDRPPIDRVPQQQQPPPPLQRTGANAAGAAFVKLFRRPPGRSTSFVIPPLKDKPQRPSELQHSLPLQPPINLIHRTSSEQQLSRHPGSNNSKDGGTAFNSLSPRPSSASFSHNPLARASQNSVQHSPVQGNSSSQQPTLLEQLEEEQPGPNEGTPETAPPSRTSPTSAPVAVAVAPGQRTVSASGLSAMEEERAALDEEAAATGATGFPGSPLQPPGVGPEEALVTAMPRKGLHARAAAAPLQQRRGSPRSPSSPSGTSQNRSISAQTLQPQQQHPQPLHEQQAHALLRTGTGGSDSVASSPGGGGPAGAAFAGGSGDGSGGDRLHRFTRTGSGIPQAALPHVNFQGLNALRAMGAACRRRSSLWSCGSNEDTRHSPQATGVLPRVMSERVPAETHAAQMGMSRRVSVAIPNQAEQAEASSPLPHAGPRRTRRASLDLGATTHMANWSTQGQPSRHPAAPPPSSNRSPADPFNLASPVPGMGLARGSRVGRASMDLSAFAVPLQHLAQASSMVAHSSLPPSSAPTQSRLPAGHRVSMDFGSSAVRPNHLPPSSQPRNVSPGLHTITGPSSAGSNRGQRRSMDASAFVAPLQHAPSVHAHSSSSSRRSISSAAASAAAGFPDAPRSSQGQGTAAASQPHPQTQPLGMPVGPSRRRPASDQPQQPPPPHPHPSRRSQRRGSVDMGVLSDLASAAMQSHLASQHAHPHAQSSSSAQQQLQPPPPSGSDPSAHANNLGGLPCQQNSSAEQLAYFPYSSAMQFSPSHLPFSGPPQAGVGAPTQRPSQLLQQQPLQDGASSTAAGIMRRGHRKSSNCSSTSTGVDIQGEQAAAAAAGTAPAATYQGPVRSHCPPVRTNSRGLRLRFSCTNTDVQSTSAGVSQEEMARSSSGCADGILPDTEDRDVCGAFPMPKATATGTGTGSRRVSIAPGSSTENSWRESSHSHGSSMPQRSSSNLQPTQQARSRRGSRVSGEGAIPLQASGAGNKRSSSGVLEGLEHDNGRPSSSSKSGATSIFGSLVQVSNRHMLRLLPGHKDRSPVSHNSSGGGSSVGASPALTLMASPTFQRRMSLGGGRRPDPSCDGEGEREEGLHKRRSSGAGEGGSSRSRGASGGGEGPSGGGRLRGAGDRERNSHGRQKRRSSWGLALSAQPHGPDGCKSSAGGEKGKN
ncbi:hypothetical protein DUNSADRAFT_10070 [Dunaliella salina]|uniref:Uncharacterized protein n=1 Tax=Dunaliella salina TaxID=3046 RepID=A0ABQ7GG49_DUNSA|nr:hypothetical protein DUNSADRAFT_10070 [Dunaliella salina]|eukprot:KAF5833579.1 hypothetical protein DUNSADRAFT_10070 [Dunaliella salina]